MKEKMIKRALGIVLTLTMAISLVNTNTLLARADEAQWVATTLIRNGDFETALGEEWVVSDSAIGYESVDEWASNNKTTWFKLYTEAGGDFSLSQTVEGLEPGKYKVAFEQEGGTWESGLSIDVDGDSTAIAAALGWDSWSTVEKEFEVTENKDVVITVKGNMSAGYWGAFDNFVLYKLASSEDEKKDEPSDSEEDKKDETPSTEDTTIQDAKVTVAKVTKPDGSALDSDFITGVDVSSYISIINSGAKFYSADGTELSQQGFFNLLAQGGTNYVRVRVWNNPYDANGNGYGGGTNDLETAKKIGILATNAGMKVLVDFHFSDFWADPGKQKAPKAWDSMSVLERTKAISEYTTTSLNTLLDAGVDVGMVQIGNETTNSFCGISFSKYTADCCSLFDAGCDAVHAVANERSKTILAAIHFTNPERASNYGTFAKRLADNNVSYDVFASSYYPYWHGTLTNLTSVLKNVADTYGVKVMVAETSWAWTLDDGDGHENTVRVGNNDSNNSENYDFTVQGQCTEIRDVAQAVASVGDAGIGLFYWEAAWIPVQYAYNEDGSLNQEILASNKTLWEKYGSGWASSYASEYDPTDAGKWFGGSAVDNQAWFDFNGKALETTNVYKYIKAGSKSKPVFTSISVEDMEIELSALGTLSLPDKALVKYSDGSSEKVAVIFPENALEEVKTGGVGTYEIKGEAVVEDVKREVLQKITVVPTNLLVNGDFENGTNGWEISKSILNTNDAASNSRGSSSGCLHFWTNEDNDEATAVQTVKLSKGYYNLEGYIQGGSQGEKDQFTISLVIDDKTYQSENAKIGTWKEWDKLSVSDVLVEKDTEAKVVVKISSLTSGVWGSFDDLKLYKSGEIATANDNEVVKPGNNKKPVSNTVNTTNTTGTTSVAASNTATLQEKSEKNTNRKTTKTKSSTNKEAEPEEAVEEALEESEEVVEEAEATEINEEEAPKAVSDENPVEVEENSTFLSTIAGGIALLCQSIVSGFLAIVHFFANLFS